VSIFRELESLRPVVVAEGVAARTVDGERITLAVVDLEPNAVVAEHRHENEQLGFVIRGAITMRIGTEVRELKPGDTYNIPSNIEHGAAAGPEGATVTDVFAPVRADWHDKEHAEPSPGDWP
jgi:quercetin dioxygenase-like cupin family protein